MWAKGISATEIAKILGSGFTKNSVVGKIHRLQGKETIKRDARPRSAVPPKVKMKSIVSHETLNGASPMMTPMPENQVTPVSPPKPIEVFVEPGPQGVNMMDLGPLHCRAPLWSGDTSLRRGGVDSIMFCGMKKTLGSSYCEQHFSTMVSAVISAKRVR